jgi:hypothetical protein
LPSERRTSTSFANCQKFPKHCIHLCSGNPAQRSFDGYPLAAAESSLLPSMRSGIWLRTTGPFQGLHFLIGCNIRGPQAAGRLHIQQARTVV